MTLLVVKKSAGLHQALFLMYSDPIYLWRLLPLLCLCPYILGTNGPSHSNFCLSGQVLFDRQLCFKLVEKYQGWLLPGERWPPIPECLWFLDLSSRVLNSPLKWFPLLAIKPLWTPAFSVCFLLRKVRFNEFFKNFIELQVLSLPSIWSWMSHFTSL